MNAIEDKTTLTYYGSIKVFNTLAMSKKFKLNTEDLISRGFTHIIIH